MQKVLSVAVFVYDGWEERQKAELVKERKKAKEWEANSLVAALARNLQLTGGS